MWGEARNLESERGQSWFRGPLPIPSPSLFIAHLLPVLSRSLSDEGVPCHLCRSPTLLG